jgi:DNA-binding transcriptional LysR family regulator
MVMDVHLRDLRYFVATAEEFHFTPERRSWLRVSRPALTKQIRLLERQLEFALFTRDRRRSRWHRAARRCSSPPGRFAKSELAVTW